MARTRGPFQPAASRTMRTQAASPFFVHWPDASQTFFSFALPAPRCGALQLAAASCSSCEPRQRANVQPRHLSSVNLASSSSASHHHHHFIIRFVLHRHGFFPLRSRVDSFNSATECPLFSFALEWFLATSEPCGFFPLFRRSSYYMLRRSSACSQAAVAACSSDRKL